MRPPCTSRSSKRRHEHSSLSFPHHVRLSEDVGSLTEPDRLQLGEPVGPAGATEKDRELVADQLAATVGEDRRQADQARPVLLAPVGRGPSDEAGVRGDSTADLGAAFTGGLEAGGLPARKSSEGKEGGTVELSENCAERRPSCRLAPDRKAYRPLLMGTGTASGNARQETWSQSEATWRIL